MRVPAVDDKMVIAGSDTLTVTTNEGVVEGWRLTAKDVATVVEVNNDSNLLKLRTAHGIVSCWQPLNKFKYIDDPSRKKPVLREPRSGGKRAQLKAAERFAAEAQSNTPSNTPASLLESLPLVEALSPEVTPEQTERPSDADISFCVSVLRRLQPNDLEDIALAELLEVAGKLFKRKFFKDKFGSSEAVEFLKNRVDIDRKIKQLQNLEQIVNGYRETKKQSAENCGQNLARKITLENINAQMALLNAEDQAVKSIKDQETCPRIEIDNNEASADDQVETANAENVEHSPRVEDVTRVSLGPKGDYHHTCNCCGGSFREMHHFYHQLCKDCAQLSWDKRTHTADMTGMVCVVTGGRVRIGYQIVLKLLRAGAFVLTTSRFPLDCAQRFSREEDFDCWRGRLEIVGPVELSNMRLVEHFCDQLIARFQRIHVLINNAAQTLTRAEGWHYRMGQLEANAESSLSEEARALVKNPAELVTICDIACDKEPEIACVPQETAHESSVPLSPSQQLVCNATSSNHIGAIERNWSEAIDLADFPKGKLDASGQPLDLTAQNSWDRKLCDVSTMELLQTLAANAAAPFIMCSRLASVLEPPTKEDPFGHIVNVQALEGKFSVKKKSRCHPHTNMAKAALNMLTHTSANDLFRRRILMNNADTGWVTDMASGGVGPMAATHATFVEVPMDEIDGASRVLDPVFSHLNDPTWLIRGKLFKDYRVVNW